MPLIAVSLVSAGVIGLEVLLTRLYSIVQWHHFAYMIISIAMLGFGASGTFLALARSWLLQRLVGVWQINAVAFGLASVIGFGLAQRSPFNPLELVWDPWQGLYLSQVYLALMVPFFCAANCIGLAFMHFGGRAGRVYRFDLMGAGAGAVGIIAALFLLMPSDCLRLILALGFLAAGIAGFGAAGPWAWRRGLSLGIAGVACAALLPGSWIAPRLSEFKGLSQALRVPGAEILHRGSSPLGLITVVQSPEVPFRHAPGLSLNATDEPPAQYMAFVDGEGMTAITRHDGDRDKLAYLDFTTEALPYHLLARPDVLILGAGGGAGVLLALYHGAGRIDAVELDPAVVRLVRGRFAEFAGGIYAPDRVMMHIAEARGYVAATDDRYDLIQVPALESFGTAAAGVGGLSETYVYTVEAFEDYLARLNPGGIVAVTRWVKLPARDALKLFATAIEALQEGGVEEPSRRLVLLRGWQTTTLLAKNGEFSARDIAQLRTFARERSFDLAYYPGIRRAEANRYNRLDGPSFHDGAVALLGPQRRAFIDGYKFDLRPARDDRPYFFDFFRWRALPELLALRAQGGMPLIEWGYLILSATLVQAVALSTLLILLPLAVWHRRAIPMPGRGRVVTYFLALGLAFLFVEIAFIQRLVLFLGHPLYAVALVLAAFLMFAGLGAGASQHIATRLGRVLPIRLAVAAIALLAVLYLVVLPPLTQWLLPAPAGVKVAACLALIAPLAFWMGMPFPLALASLAERAPDLVPWAWGINGCASVVSAVLATLLAIGFGFTAVVGLAVVLYGLAAAVWR